MANKPILSNIIFLFLFAVFSLMGFPSKGLGKNYKNVIFITIDTLRPDHLGLYGYKRNTSPNLDKLASHSIVYENCFSHASETGPSIASLFSGYHPHETTVTRNNISLPKQLMTLPEYFKQEGFKTAAIIGNYVLRRKYQFNQGFDEYDDQLPDPILTRKSKEKTARTLTDRALKWLSKNRNENFFLWLHYMDPHGPYTPEPPFDTQFNSNDYEGPSDLKFNDDNNGWRGIPKYQRIDNNRDFGFYAARYDGEIRYTDYHLGRLFERLKKLGLYNNSVIVITSDHGEEMGEHERYFSHGESLFRTGIHVPLIIKMGDKAEHIITPVQHIDVLPTLLEIFDISPQAKPIGLNLVSQDYEPRPILAQIRSLRAWIDYPWFLLRDTKKKRDRLYNTKVDPLQHQNLALKIKHKSRRIFLKKQLKKALLQREIHISPSQPQTDQETLETLKSLGYTQ